MNKKALKTLETLLVVVAIVSSVLNIHGNIRVYADNGETVRVSTAKQLKAAIKINMIRSYIHSHMTKPEGLCIESS